MARYAPSPPPTPLPAADDSVEGALRRCSELFLDELHLSRSRLGAHFDLEWKAHAQLAARLLVPLLHLSGGSRAALQFAEDVAKDGGVEMLVEAGVAKPLARIAAAQACASGEAHDPSASELLGKLLLDVFEAPCGHAFAEELGGSEAVACLLLAIEGPRAPRSLPDTLLDKVEGKCLDAIMTTALSRVWAAWSPEACECVCEVAIRAFAASTHTVETFFDLGGAQISLGAKDPTKVLRLFAAASENVAKAPRLLRLPNVESLLRSKLVDAIVRGSYDNCHVAMAAAGSVLSNDQLFAIVFEDDSLVCRVSEEFLRRVEVHEAHAPRIACRGFARGMARALAADSFPSRPLLATVVQAYCRTEATVGDRDARMAACHVLCHWCARAGGIEPQLIVLRDAFKLLTADGSESEVHSETLDASATLLIDCIHLPSLSLPREHIVFLIAHSLAGRKCPPGVGALGRRFRRLLAEVAQQFGDAYADNRPMLQHALDTINFYDVLCETTREELLHKLRALPPGPAESSVMSDLKCPITLQPLVFPVLMPDTNTYELEAIVTHFLCRGGDLVSPLTRAPMALAPVYNRALARVAADMATRVHGRRRRRTPPLCPVEGATRQY